MARDDGGFRAWMADNAYTIVFLGVMFFVTWVLLVLSNFGEG